MFNFEEQSNSDQMEGLISRFEEMVKEHSDYFFDVQEFEDIIDYYLDQNDPDKCKSAIRSAIGQHPSCVGFRFKKALFLISTNKYNEALKILDAVELLEPTNAEIFLTKGIIYSHQKKFDLSIEAYKQGKLLHQLHPYHFFLLRNNNVYGIFETTKLELSKKEEWMFKQPLSDKLNLIFHFYLEIILRF